MDQKILVTGADQHQGLAVVRGLGMAGIPVLATSPVQAAIGQVSRYATETATYTPPQESQDRFVEEIIELARQHGVTMIMAVAESTLVALDNRRERVEQVCPLAAPESSTLNQAIDKLATLRLATAANVPAPKTCYAESVDEALKRTRDFRFPVVIKPRGNALHARTKNQLGFKVKYARTPSELKSELTRHTGAGALPMIQEFVRGHGVNVTVLADRGRPIAMVPYEKVREVPLTGGVSVLRRTLELHPPLRDYVTRLLEKSRWHGVAMVEFKCDSRTGEYTLMEINGRYCASTALLIDAGVNLPFLAYRLHAGLPVDKAEYRVGVSERWLQGDFNALMQHLRGITGSEAAGGSHHSLPSRSRAMLNFLTAFRPGVYYDEFKWNDWRPGLFEILSWRGGSLRIARAALRKAFRAAPLPRN